MEKTILEEVKSRRQLRKFITFPEKLFKDCPQWVPPLITDEFDTLGGNNAAMDFCEHIMYLAYRDGEIVGRVAGIINYNANKDWGENTVRFGWIDFVNDLDVASALIDAVVRWGKSKGMTRIKGPLGFTDMDKEGLLVEGFDKLSPFTCIYNYPYYNELLEKLGFVKDTDWTQQIVYLPDELPQVLSYASLVEQRFGLKVAQCKNTREFGRRYGMSIFHMYNECFAPLYEFSKLTDKQIKRYLQTYVPILDPDFVCVLVDGDDNVVAFCFCVPSLAKAVKKSRGRLFPFGLLRILKSLKKNDTLEALLIGIHPDYQGKGASALIFKHIQESCNRRGIKFLLANPMLETNFKVQTLWGVYEHEQYMRRRSYVKDI